jgi:3-methylfumaryl-CoA hydratase
MTEAIMDLTQLRGWIGKEEVAEERLTEALAEKFQATLELSGKAPHDGERAPRLIHFCLCQPAVPTAMLGPDGHVARGGFLPPVPLPRRMWAGGDLHFSGDLTVGQTVRRRSRVVDVALKTGKSGNLCFVAVDHSFEADGVLRIEERQTIVYRENQKPGSRSTGGAAPAPEAVMDRSVVAAPALLFRYSALTFNTHRIHYDRSYACEKEGYPGLVVHAPLQATLLLHFATEGGDGRPPDRFSFRSVSPIFDLDEIRLFAGRRNANRTELWTARVGGPIAMRAEAIWS